MIYLDYFFEVSELFFFAMIWFEHSISCSYHKNSFTYYKLVKPNIYFHSSSDIKKIIKENGSVVFFWHWILKLFVVLLKFVLYEYHSFVSFKQNFNFLFQDCLFKNFIHNLLFNFFQSHGCGFFHYCRYICSLKPPKTFSIILKSDTLAFLYSEKFQLWYDQMYYI